MGNCRALLTEFCSVEYSRTLPHRIPCKTRNFLILLVDLPWDGSARRADEPPLSGASPPNPRLKKAVSFDRFFLCAVCGRSV